MTSSLVHDIDQLLSAIEDTQSELARIYRAKREAMRKAQADALNRLTETEQGLVSQFQAQLGHRREILQRTESGGRHDTLESLVQTFESDTRDRLLGRIARMRETADANRRESWIIWIVSQQSLRLFKEMVDLIANGGRKAPIYAVRPGVERATGGVILDASA